MSFQGGRRTVTRSTCTPLLATPSVSADGRPLGPLHEQAASSPIRRNLEAEQRGQGREEVDALHLIRTAPRMDAGSGDHERHVEQLVVEMRPVKQEAVLLELLAVIGDHDHHGRIAQAEACEAVEQRRQLAVPAPDLAVVEGAQVRDLVGGEAAARRAGARSRAPSRRRDRGACRAAGWGALPPAACTDRAAPCTGARRRSDAGDSAPASRGIDG